MNNTFTDHSLASISFAGLLALFAIVIAHRLHFFDAKKIRTPFISAGQVVIIFTLFIGCHLIFAPVLLLLASRFTYGDWGSLDSDQGLLFVIPLLLVIILGYFAQKRELAASVFGSLKPGHLLFGAAAWLIAYPVSAFIAFVASILTEQIISFTRIDQLQVAQLKDLLEHPYLLYPTIAGVILAVPLIEEILFRGVLQNFFLRFFPPLLSIIFASIIFSAFHFMPGQEWTNVEILTFLFTFSLFLGWVYLRQGSLLASYSLHALFNAISVCVILIS